MNSSGTTSAQAVVSARTPQQHALTSTRAKQLDTSGDEENLLVSNRSLGDCDIARVIPVVNRKDHPCDENSSSDSHFDVEHSQQSEEESDQKIIATPTKDERKRHDRTQDDKSIDRGQSISRSQVAKLMREQDADLLESIHLTGPNATDETPPVFMRRSSETLTKTKNKNAAKDPRIIAAPTAIANITLVAHGVRVKKKNLATFHNESSTLIDSGTGANNQHEENEINVNEEHVRPNESFCTSKLAMRQSLSGDVWVNKMGDEFSDQEAVNHVNAKLQQSLVQEDSDVVLYNKQHHSQDERDELTRSLEIPKRTESSMENRRVREAVQFAEAVGEFADTEMDELRIIEEDCDDDDDDDDDGNPATEICISSPARSSKEDQSLLNVHINEEVEILRPIKKRPQFPPFQGTIGSYIDKLPDKGTQDFVYKGIRSNPPKIVKRGTDRGNYAQLHRKAWLEVSDKYHRYGKNLRLYYRYWERMGCPTNMFFDWIDSKGEAAGRPLPCLEDCPRSTLDSDTVLYITNPEITDGYVVKFVSQPTGRALVTDVDGDPVKTGLDGWIFVLRDNVMYAAQKITSVTGHSKQRFHHSSFFGGKAVAAAGIFITDEEGYLTRLYPHSGHYRPGEPHIQRMFFFLYHQGVDLHTFDMDTQQIIHIARENTDDKTKKEKESGIVASYACNLGGLLFSTQGPL